MTDPTRSKSDQPETLDDGSLVAVVGGSDNGPAKRGTPQKPGGSPMDPLINTGGNGAEKVDPRT